MPTCVRTKYKISRKLIDFFYLNTFICKLIKEIIFKKLHNSTKKKMKLILKSSETLPLIEKLLAYYTPLDAIPHQ